MVTHFDRPVSFAYVIIVKIVNEEYFFLLYTVQEPICKPLIIHFLRLADHVLMN